MIFTINVGNRHVEIGLMESHETVLHDFVVTDVRKTALEYAFDLLGVLEKGGFSAENVTGGIVSSVVPQLSLILAQAAERVFGITPFIASIRKQSSLRIALDDPNTLGTNLLADAVAVKAFYGCPALFADLGTATAVGVIDAEGVYQGGVIMPGLQTSVNALFGGTAALPQLQLTEASTVFSRETAACINAGALFGGAGALDGMLDRLREELGTDPRIVLTGRPAGLLLPYLEHKAEYDPALTLKGLSLLYEERQKEVSA
jgi:type III pantothenate kinase